MQEIRIRDASGAFRIIYLARLPAAIYVLHCFKETQKTGQADQDLAARRYRDLLEGTRIMSNQRFDSVWDALEDTAEVAENMKLRSVLMMALKRHIERNALSQAQAAQIFGVTQPRVSDLMRGKINLFGLDALVNMIAAAGMHIEMRVLEAA